MSTQREISIGPHEIVTIRMDRFLTPEQWLAVGRGICDQVADERRSGDPTPVQPVGCEKGTEGCIKVHRHEVCNDRRGVEASKLDGFEYASLARDTAEATVEHCKVAEIMLDAKSGDMPQPWRRVTIGLLVDALSRNEHATAAVRDSNEGQPTCTGYTQQRLRCVLPADHEGPHRIPPPEYDERFQPAEDRRESPKHPVTGEDYEAIFRTVRAEKETLRAKNHELHQRAQRAEVENAALRKVAEAARMVREHWFGNYPMASLNESTSKLWAALDAVPAHSSCDPKVKP
jgi:hypothetical protein